MGSRQDNSTPDPWLVEPSKVLQAHRSRVNALRLESGYDSDQFEKLIGTVLVRAAEWVHCLPATKAENHSETGGLLRFAIETASLAFRRSDGKFLAGPSSTDIRNRERDRVLRYAVLLGGLLRPLGRCITHLKVLRRDAPSIWNPLAESLWHWQRRDETRTIEIGWRDAVDARPTAAASMWIAARIIPDHSLAYLQSADESLPETLLRVVSGDRTGRLCEIVEEAYQAAIDQDIARRGSGDRTTQAHVQTENRLLEALRALCREKWTVNNPGGRLWCTESGVFLVWKAAAGDMSVRMRAEGISGIPRDPDTLAELLVGHGVLGQNPNVTSGLKHYYKILPQLRGVPKQALEVVKLVDTELVGLQLQGVDRIPVEIVGLTASSGSPSSDSRSEENPLQLPLAPESKPAVKLEAAHAEPPPLPPPVNNPSPASAPESTASLDRLMRFGEPGRVLHKLAEQLLSSPHARLATRVPEGVAIGFPESIAPFCAQPQEFLTACESQGLLVPEKSGGRRFVRARTAEEPHLPTQYIVLAPRIARHLPVPGGESR